MQDSLIELKFNSSINNFDSIKLMRAVIKTYITMYSEDILDIAARGGFVISEPMYEIDGSLHIENNIIPINLSSLPTAIRDTEMNKRKKKRFININKLDELSQLLNENDYKSLILAEKKLESFEGIFKTVEEKILPVPDFRPGINIPQDNFFIREMGRVQNRSVFIIVRHENVNILSSLYATLDMGVSAKRSIGNGNIEIIKKKPFVMEGFKGPGLYLLISPFIPNSSDFNKIDFSKSFYRVNKFSGRDYNGKSFSIYRYVQPGSFLFLNGEPEGLTDKYEDQFFIFKGFFLKGGTKNEV